MSRVGYRQVEIADLEGANAKGFPRLPWEQRVDLIKGAFPAVEVVDWRGAFDKDLDLFAAIIGDILKADGATPGRSGPKPGVDLKAGTDRLRQLMGEDYSHEPFQEAFRILVGARSLTMAAGKTGLSRSQVNRLLKGICSPSAYEMEVIAKAFGKEPGYFLEYRAHVVLSAISYKLHDVPESSVKFYRDLQGVGK